MSQWGVGAFVSRVAERVSTAGEGFAAQIVVLGERGGDDEALAYARLEQALPFVEPSPEFVSSLHQRLMTTPIRLEDEIIPAPLGPDRRIVYGVAAIGSLASAAVLAALVIRTRTFHRAA